MSYMVFSPWENLKGKQKELWREKTYLDMIINSLLQIFNYSNVPEGLEIEHMEQYLLLDGIVGIAKHNNIIVALRGGLSGELDNYGHGTRFVGSCPNFSIDERINEGCAIIYNNKVHTPEAHLLWFAEQLGQTDLSQVFNIQKTRINPIVVTENDKQSKTIERVQKELKYGNECPTVSKGGLNWNEETNSIEVIELSDPSLISKVQYLSEYHDVLLQRLYSYYGVSCEEKTKHSYSSDNEQYSHSLSSFIYISNMLEERKKGVEMINRVFNTNMSVDYSELIKRNFEKLKAELETPIAEVENLKNETEETEETDKPEEVTENEN